MFELTVSQFGHVRDRLTSVDDDETATFEDERCRHETSKKSRFRVNLRHVSHVKLLQG
jgi:hypothetical protein